MSIKDGTQTMSICLILMLTVLLGVGGVDAVAQEDSIMDGNKNLRAVASTELETFVIGWFRVPKIDEPMPLPAVRSAMPIQTPLTGFPVSEREDDHARNGIVRIAPNLGAHSNDDIVLATHIDEGDAPIPTELGNSDVGGHGRIVRIPDTLATQYEDLDADQAAVLSEIADIRRRVGRSVLGDLPSSSTLQISSQSSSDRHEALPLNVPATDRQFNESLEELIRDRSDDVVPARVLVHPEDSTTYDQAPRLIPWESSTPVSVREQDRQLVSDLRALARQLDQRAADAEDIGDYVTADQIRSTAQQMREEARRLLSVPNQTATLPEAVSPIPTSSR